MSAVPSESESDTINGVTILKHIMTAVSIAIIASTNLGVVCFNMVCSDP